MKNIQKLNISEMKKMLIDNIDDLNENNFLNKLSEKDKELGASNIRSMANIALNSDCYEEFRLFMEYKKVKGQGKGWGTKINSNQTLADKVIEHLEEIHKQFKGNDKEILKWISQYFGYLYWKRVATTEIKLNNNDKNNNRYGSEKTPNRNNYSASRKGER